MIDHRSYIHNLNSGEKIQTRTLQSSGNIVSVSFKYIKYQFENMKELKNTTTRLVEIS